MDDLKLSHKFENNLLGVLLLIWVTLFAGLLLLFNIVGGKFGFLNAIALIFIVLIIFEFKIKKYM